MNANPNARTDNFHGTRRLWYMGRVHTGLVSVPGKGGYSMYEVRRDGEVIKQVYGLSKTTMRLAREVAATIPQ